MLYIAEALNFKARTNRNFQRNMLKLWLRVACVFEFVNIKLNLWFPLVCGCSQHYETVYFNLKVNRFYVLQIHMGRFVSHLYVSKLCITYNHCGMHNFFSSFTSSPLLRIRFSIHWKILIAYWCKFLFRFYFKKEKKINWFAHWTDVLLSVIYSDLYNQHWINYLRRDEFLLQIRTRLKHKKTMSANAVKTKIKIVSLFGVGTTWKILYFFLIYLFLKFEYIIADRFNW